ncbi:MAG TPA: hypothetical protein VD968_12825, partial [Pyrinomonadaceae bacterium]|nr:hypothetical protein [Pyrinomonadaceae bacterium]
LRALARRADEEEHGRGSHAARLASEGDRPHHRPGESVDSHGHAGAHAHGGAADDVFDDDEEHEEQHHHGPVEPHESPLVMTVPLVILAVLSTFGGLLGVPYALSGGAIPNYFEHTLEPAVAHVPAYGAESHGAAGATGHGAPAEGEGSTPQAVGEGTSGAGYGAQTAAADEHAHDPTEVTVERIFTAVSVLIAAIGIGAGWGWFKRRPLYQMPRLLEEKYYVDEAYDAAVITPTRRFSREGLWKFFDVTVIDGIVNGLGRGTTQVGALLRYMQPGFVRSYAAIILLGALAVVGFFAYNAYQLLR